MLDLNSQTQERWTCGSNFQLFNWTFWYCTSFWWGHKWVT